MSSLNERVVVKRDGSTQIFNKTKIERWAKYAAKHDVDWCLVADSTIARLPKRVSTEEVHETMINVCLDMEQLEYSRVAARLLYAKLRKNMSVIGITDRQTFKEIHSKFTGLKLWNSVEYDVGMEQQYTELFKTKLEYWQIKQWMDKYSLQYGNEPVETPHMGALALGYAVHGNSTLAFDLAKAVIRGQINLPTPALNGIRNGDWNTISCSVIEGGDTIPSIGVADHLAYMMTAKKAGIGIKFNTRSINDDVKGGAVKHLGKLPIYATVDKAVKMFTQVTRGGSATVTFSVYDPEVMEIIMVKSQRTPENKRIDKLDYSMAYDNAFVQSVIDNGDIVTRSITGGEGNTYAARDVLKAYLTVRKETGRLYCINLDEANDHTPFLDRITQSNLCLEIALPTEPFVGMQDLYSETSEGEMAFCTLGALNVAKIKPYEYEHLAFVLVATLNKLITNVEMFAPSLKNNLLKRRSLGIGITGLATHLYDVNKSYSDKVYLEKMAERHYYFCLKASQRLAGVYGSRSGIDLDWLPIDTKKTTTPSTMDWEALRGHPRANSVLVAHMPTESSAVFSNSTNGLYPVRRRVINKQSRKGTVQFIAPPVRELAWDIPTTTMTYAYAAFQAYTDQAISADYYVGKGKVSMKQMITEWLVHSKSGLKTAYYLNTNDYNGGSFQEQSVGGCESGACTL